MDNPQPHAASTQRRARTYRLMRLPVWVRGAAGGVIFGGLMLAYARVSDDRPGPLLFAVAGAGVAAVLFAIPMTFFIRMLERRVFDADGLVLTADERVLVMQAVDVGRWPDDPRLHPAASRVVAQRLGAAERPPFQVTVLGLMLALAVLQAITLSVWWWAAVVFWLVLGPWAVFSSRRRRRPAQRMRDTAPA